MPELPEVETVMRGLAPTMERASVVALDVRRRDLRFPFPEKFAERIAGRTIVGLSRRAKYLLIDLDDGMTVIAHLGTSGSFRIEEGSTGEDLNGSPGHFYHPRSKDEKHDHVVFHLLLDGARRRVVYNDPRRFGFMDMVVRTERDLYPAFRALGPEATGNARDANHLAHRFKGKKQPLKSALLNQKTIAGLRQYLCLRSAVAGAPCAKAGGSSLRDHIRAYGTLGYFQHSFSVYDREGAPCPTPGCPGTIRRIVQAGRSSFYCACCQK